MLEKINLFYQEMIATNSQTEKKVILKKWLSDMDVRAFLKIMLNPYLTFGVTANGLKAKESVFETSRNHSGLLMDLLEGLASRKYTGHLAISLCISVIRMHPQYRNLLYLIFDKDLKIGIDTLIHKVEEGFVPKFDVALAQKYDDSDKTKKLLQQNEYVIMRKLDGVRCICRKENGIITYRSREGREYTQLDRVTEALTDIMPDNTVFDGEICVLEDSGKENFKEAVSQIRRKDFTMENPHFKIFDFMSTSEFDAGVSQTRFTRRLFGALETLGAEKTQNFSVISAVQYNPRNFEKALALVDSKGWEGLMLRADTGYKSGRSTDMLKVKKFVDAEYLIEDILPTTKQMLNALTGRMEDVTCAGHVIIRHKGNAVGVGSGFTDEDRISIWQNRAATIGRKITVKYFEETQDAKGNVSLRFPIFKGFRDKE